MQVIAVLLDEFISSVESEKHRERMELVALHEREFLKSQGALDRLCFTLTEFNTPAELDNEIRELFQSLDRQESGRLTFHEVRNHRGAAWRSNAAMIWPRKGEASCLLRRRTSSG